MSNTLATRKFRLTPETTPVKTVVEILQERQERASQGEWIPACGRTETPFFTRTGRKLLYCYQPTTGNHAYLDCMTDMILSEEEARAALATY